MRYTVIGLVDPEGGLLVAGVVEGDVDLVDQDHGDSDWTRWAGSFDATDPSDAERQAYEEVAELYE